MTPNEFKAWFDGFCEAFDKTPTQKQWARIKERVAEIDGKPVTERVFVDRYWPPYQKPYFDPYYWRYGGYTAGATVCGQINQANLAQDYQNNLKEYQLGQSAAYNSTNAMNALGRAEAQAMTQ